MCDAPDTEARDLRVVVFDDMLQLMTLQQRTKLVSMRQNLFDRVRVPSKRKPSVNFAGKALCRPRGGLAVGGARRLPVPAESDPPPASAATLVDKGLWRMLSEDVRAYISISSETVEPVMDLDTACMTLTAALEWWRR